jgi:hypothetical protein
MKVATIFGPYRLCQDGLRLETKREKEVMIVMKRFQRREFNNVEPFEE